MTEAQRAYLLTLCLQAKEPFRPDLTKAEASRMIDQLKQKAGAGSVRESRHRYLTMTQMVLGEGLR